MNFDLQGAETELNSDSEASCTSRASLKTVARAVQEYGTPRATMTVARGVQLCIAVNCLLISRV